jgi:ribonucleotide reductase alpha subunit
LHYYKTSKNHFWFSLTYDGEGTITANRQAFELSAAPEVGEEDPFKVAYDLYRQGRFTDSVLKFNEVFNILGQMIYPLTKVPDEIKSLYKTVWEIPQRAIIDMAADRGAFICQSQSMNLYFREPNVGKIGAGAYQVGDLFAIHGDVE